MNKLCNVKVFDFLFCFWIYMWIETSKHVWIYIFHIVLISVWENSMVSNLNFLVYNIALFHIYFIIIDKQLRLGRYGTYKKKDIIILFVFFGTLHCWKFMLNRSRIYVEVEIDSFSRSSKKKKNNILEKVIQVLFNYVNNKGRNSIYIYII